MKRWKKVLLIILIIFLLFFIGCTTIIITSSSKENQKEIPNYQTETITSSPVTRGMPDSPSPTALKFILNTDSLKFHKPSCPFVSKIAEENYQEYIGTREELVQNGYEPCGRCNP